MLGSTRADWTSPPFDHVVNLNSDDLPCGNCMLPECKFRDNRCLTRYTPQRIVEIMLNLLPTTANSSVN